MINRTDILNELGELNSSLATQNVENVYAVPAGYFEGLADKIMSRIRASEAETVDGELNRIAPLLTGISRQTPYHVSPGYFEGLEKRVMDKIRLHEDWQTSEEEIAFLSPLLSNLKQANPYSVPAGYFETLSAAGDKSAPAEPERKVKVISITSRKWFRYAAAAVVTGIIVISGLKLLNSGTRTSTNEKAIAKIEKKLAKDIKNNKISTEEVEAFLDLTEAIASTDTKATVNPGNKTVSNDYLKDVSDDEIIDFLDQLPEETNDNGILN